MASILKVRDKNGHIVDIPVIKGDKGDSYVLTEADKISIKDAVISELDMLGGSGGGGVTVVDTYADLPEEAEEGTLYYVANDSYGEDDWRQFEFPYTPEGETIEGISQISFYNSIEETFDNFKIKFDGLEEVEYSTSLGGVLSNGNYFDCGFMCFKMEGMELKGIMLMEYNAENEEIGAMYIIANDAALFAQMMEMPLEFSNNKWTKISTEYFMGEEDVEMNIITEELEEAPVFNISTFMLTSTTYDSDDEEILFYEDILIDPASSLNKFYRWYNNVSLYLAEAGLSFVLANYASKMPSGLFIFEDELWKSLSGDETTRVYKEDEPYLNSYSIPYANEGDVVTVEFPVIEPPLANSCTIQNNSSSQYLYITGYYQEHDHLLPYFLRYAGAFMNEVSEEVFEKLNGKTISFGGEPGYTGSKYGNSFCLVAVLNGMVVLSGGYEIKAVYFKEAGITFNPSDFGVLGEENTYSFTSTEKGWYYLSFVPIKLNLSVLSIENLLGRTCSLKNTRKVYIIDGISPIIPDLVIYPEKISVNGLFCRRPGPGQYSTDYYWACVKINNSCNISCQDYPIRTDIEYKNGEWTLPSTYMNRRIESSHHEHDNKQYLDQYTELYHKALSEYATDYSKAVDMSDRFILYNPSTYSAYDYYKLIPAIGPNPSYGLKPKEGTSYETIYHRIAEHDKNFQLIPRNVDRKFYYDYLIIDPRDIKEVLSLDGAFSPTVESFRNCANKLAIIPFIDTSKITESDNWYNLFRNDSSGTQYKTMGYASINPISDASNSTKFNNCFYGCHNLKCVYLMIKASDDTETASYDFRDMFNGCTQLQTVYFHFIPGSTQTVIRASSMEDMFYSVNNLEDVIFHCASPSEAYSVQILLDTDLDLSGVYRLSRETLMHLIGMCRNVDGVSASVIIGNTNYSRLTTEDWEIINGKGISVVKTK